MLIEAWERTAMSTAKAGLAALQAAFPASHLTLEVGARYLSDWLVPAGPEDQPLALLRPRTAADVAKALTICNAHHVPVVPQGGLTGLTGGATPVRGALLISLELMNKVITVDRVSQTIIVEAGVPLQIIQEAADAAGLMFPLDIGSRGSCQIGGNVSTNAGGNRVLRYGMARDSVLGLEAVLADGTVISAMNEMMKNNAGYDLKQLFIGSEGTLGIITKVVLKLAAKPRSVALAMTAHIDYPQLEKFLMLSRSRLGGALTVFEVMWPTFYRLANGLVKRAPPLPEGAGAYSLLEVSASDENAEVQLSSLLEEGLAADVLTDATLAQSVQQSQNFWAVRDASGELGKSFDPVGNFDVSFRTSQIHDFVSECEQRLNARWPGLTAAFFGHVVDGNVHLMAGHFTPGDTEALEECVYDCVRDFGGSISAEHGIGLQKREHLDYSRTAAEISLMRRVKNALDPHGILNPGKVLM
jgi:FAD/FMN-containing dehydrogenase